MKFKYSELKNKEKLVLKEVYDLNNDSTTDLRSLINDQLQPVTVNRSANDHHDMVNYFLKYLKFKWS